MRKNEIKIDDWMRIIIGHTPAVFFIEIIIRTFFIYLVLMVAMRLMGSRMAGQLNRIEQASIVTLAAAIGVPIQTPERGIIPTAIIAIIVVFTGRGIAYKASRGQKFEQRALGKIDVLIQDGVINMDVLRQTTLTRDRIFSQLRSKEIIQLGQVKRLYFEASGTFSLIKQENEKEGLDIVPETDKELKGMLKYSGKKACHTCGSLEMPNGVCSNCYDTRSDNAVKSIKFTPFIH
jgi:uncharacterized membrane protein YcaP (DUF421 family)